MGPITIINSFIIKWSLIKINKYIKNLNAFYNSTRFRWSKRSNKRDFGLKPPKNNSKDNKEKKETVEDRIINRCKNVQNVCSSVINKHPFYGPIRKVIECKTGKDYITDEELAPSERLDRGFDVVSEIADTFGMDIPEKIERVNEAHVNLLSQLESEKGSEPDNSKNRPKSRSNSRDRSRSRSRNRNRDKNMNKKGRKGNSQKNRK